MLAVGLAIMAVSAFFLVREGGSGVGSSGPIGRITFRYRVAQRRASDRVVWDDVRPGSALYNNNFVRTDRGSEAIVELDNGTRIELDPDSMVVLQIKRGRTSIDLHRGSVSVNSADGREDVLLTASGRSLRLDRGQARVERAGSGLLVEAGRGRVLYEDSGSERELAPGSMHILDSTGVRSQPLLLGQALPEHGHRFFTNEGTATVEFAWEGSLRQLEVARDRKFKKQLTLIAVQGRRASLRLPDGIYYWRARSAEHVSESRKFRVVRLLPLVLQSPEPDARRGTPADRIALWFGWNAHRLADGYRLQIASDPTFATVAAERSLGTNGGSLALGFGTWYWRVKTRPSLPGSQVTSETRRLDIVPQLMVNPPRLIGPGPTYSLAPGERSPPFSWTSDAPSAASELVVARDAGFAAVVFRGPALGGFVRPRTDLPLGTLYWRIIDRYTGRRDALVSETGSVHLTRADRRAASPEGAAIRTPEVTRRPAKKDDPTTARVDPGPALAPRLLFPRPASSVDMTTRDSITFRWTPSAGAASYNVRLRRGGRNIFEGSTRSTTLRFSDLSKLDTGEFEVEVEAVSAAPRGSAVSKSKFRITLAETLEKPELDIKHGK